MKPETKELLQKAQQSVLASIKQQTDLVKNSTGKFLQTIADCNEELLVSSLDSVGKNLSAFIKVANLQHPDLQFLANLPNWNEFAQLVADAISISQPKSQEVEKIRTKLLTYHKGIARTMISIKPRLIANCDKKKQLRQEKKRIDNVSMNPVYANENMFYGKPCDFATYVRHSDLFLAEIARIEEQKATFINNSMPEVANSLLPRLTAIKETIEQPYCGFYRLKPTDAAVISARIYGLKWQEGQAINAPLRQFSKTSLWQSAAHESDETAQKKSFVTKDRKLNASEHLSISYQPRLYPIGWFDCIPENVQKVIDHVENLPELSGNSAFDYYWVMVPSFDVNHWAFKTSDETWKIGENAFDSATNAAIALDKIIMQEDVFTPIVFGEREGVTYFLCLWM